DECGKAPCTKTSECAAGFRCETETSDCVPIPASICDDDGVTQVNPDGTTDACSPYVCLGDHCLEQCTETTDCVAGFVCDPASKNCVAPGAGDAGDDTGCGCRVQGSARAAGTQRTMLAALFVVLVLGRRRTRPSKRH